MIRKLITYSFIVLILTSLSYESYAETYQFETKFPDYLIESGLINSITCNIESSHLKEEVNQNRLILETALENFTIDSGHNGFKFRLSKDNSLLFTLPESNVTLSSAIYKNDVDLTEELKRDLNAIASSHNTRLKTQAKVDCYEIEKMWSFLGKNIEQNEPKSLFTLFYEKRLNNAVYQKLESTKLPINYTEWSLDHNNNRIGILKLTIEYQKIDPVIIPHHFVIQYPNVSRDLNEKGEMFDLKFDNCKIE